MLKTLNIQRNSTARHGKFWRAVCLSFLFCILFNCLQDKDTEKE